MIATLLAREANTYQVTVKVRNFDAYIDQVQ